MDVPRLPGQRVFDLYLGIGQWFSGYSESNRGVSLTDDSIAWIADDKADSAPLKNIISVRLQSFSANENIPASRQCCIDFNDGKRLRVTDHAATAQHYRAFVHDLHNRLVAYGNPSVRYFRGTDRLGFRLTLATIAAFFVGFIFFGARPSWTVTAAIVAAVALLGWFADRTREENPPQYNPLELPEKLIVGDD